MDPLLASIAERKAELVRLRAQAPGGLRNFEYSQDLELTYTSNAIEGNTLTAIETTLVVEKGIAVGGKPLREHLEASTTSLRWVTCGNGRGRRTRSPRWMSATCIGW